MEKGASGKVLPSVKKNKAGSPPRARFYYLHRFFFPCPKSVCREVSKEMGVEGDNPTPPSGPYLISQATEGRRKGEEKVENLWDLLKHA